MSSPSTAPGAMAPGAMAPGAMAPGATGSPIENRNPFFKVLTKCCFIPQRWILGIMGLLGVCNAYTMRVCLNMAIIQMVSFESKKKKKVDPNACPADDTNTGSNVTRNRPYAIFDWDEALQGLILSGFYYGYLLTQFLGAWLSERYGGKYPLGIGLLSTAIFTFLIPVTTKGGGPYVLFAIRILQGMGEGPTMPALMAMLARWTPPNERAVQGALVFGGAQIGNIMGSIVSGFLLGDDKDWANVFYFFGSFGVLWFILWAATCYSSPVTHPYIGEKELTFLNKNVETKAHGNEKDPVPWKGILTSAPIWALVLAAVGHDWGYYTMVTDLPKYAHDILRFDIKSTGNLTALPYLAMWISSFACGFLCDWCTKKGWHSIRTGRIIYTTIAATGPAITIILASYAGCNRVAAMAMFILSMALMGAYYSGMKVNALDLAPNYAGSITSLINTIATISGILSPYLIGLMTPDSTMAQWRGAFWVCFVILVGTNIIYNIWAQGDQQWWDDVRKYGYPDNWKYGSLLPGEPVARGSPNAAEENRKMAS